MIRTLAQSSSPVMGAIVSREGTVAFTRLTWPKKAQERYQRTTTDSAIGNHRDSRCECTRQDPHDNFARKLLPAHCNLGQMPHFIKPPFHKAAQCSQ